MNIVDGKSEGLNNTSQTTDFESGGTLYYAGGILALLVVLVLLVVVVMVLRSGGSEYDDDDEDDDYEYQPDTSQAQAPGPIGPGPGGPSGPPPSSQSAQEDWMMDHRVDDDGTEWAEDNAGIWWFREPGTQDWTEWTD